MVSNMVRSVTGLRLIVLPTIIALLLMVVVACAPAAAPAAQPTTPPAATKATAKPVVELRAGASNPKGDQLTEPLDKFAQLVEAKTKGEVHVQVIYQSLGIEQQLVQAVQAGSVDIGQISNGNAGKFTTGFFVFDLPFIFKKYENLKQVLEEPLGKERLAQFEKDTGLKHLFVGSQGQARDIQTTKKLVKVPDDLKGVKIRALSTPVEMNIFKAWGANPTPVDWSQCFTALQQGVVDGMQIHRPQFLSQKFYEVCKYNVAVGYTASFMNQYINGKKWQSLSPEHQKAILEAAKEAGDWSWGYAADLVKSSTLELAKLGVTMTEPTADELANWTSVREKVWQDVAQEQKGQLDLDLAKKILDSQK